MTIRIECSVGALVPAVILVAQIPWPRQVFTEARQYT
jgi:hypothetical protein